MAKGVNKKRAKINTNNPRGDKRGGRKIAQRKKSKILEKTTDHILTYHLKFHHLEDSKKRCESSKCPFRFKIFKNAGQIPFIAIQQAKQHE